MHLFWSPLATRPLDTWFYGSGLILWVVVFLRARDWGWRAVAVCGIVLFNGMFWRGWPNIPTIWILLGLAGWAVLSGRWRWWMLPVAPLPIVLAEWVDRLWQWCGQTAVSHATLHASRHAWVRYVMVWMLSLSLWLPLTVHFSWVTLGFVGVVWSGTFLIVRTMPRISPVPIFILAAVTSMPAHVFPVTETARWALWTIGTVPWFLAHWVNLARGGRVWQTRYTAGLWVFGVVVAVIFWGHTAARWACQDGIWTNTDHDRPLRLSGWYGFQTAFTDLWQTRPPVVRVRLDTGPDRTAQRCWSVHWIPGQSIQTTWRIRRRRPCPLDDVWSIAFQTRQQGRLYTLARYRFPVCIWPTTRWQTLQMTSEFPFQLDPAIQEVTICSRMTQRPAPLDVQLYAAATTTPLMLIERLEVYVEHRPRIFHIVTQLSNPRNIPFTGYLHIGIIRLTDPVWPFTWYGVRTVRVRISPGAHFQWSGLVQTTRYCGQPGLGLWLQRDDAPEGYIWARLTPPG